MTEKRISLFESNYIENLQGDVNDFIEKELVDEEIIDIKFQASSTLNRHGDTETLFTIMLIWE